MYRQTLLKGGLIVTPSKTFVGDILIEDKRVSKIGTTVSPTNKVFEIDLTGKIIFPGLIDDQVHFREPGLTHKATIQSESRAAVAGGVTSFMEMPNTVPNTLTQELLQEKYDIATQTSFANYSFFMGTSNDNYTFINFIAWFDIEGTSLLEVIE
jgi:dihydroorotase